MATLQTLSDRDIEEVAGGLHVVGGPVKAPPGWPYQPQPINPGGPILITCIVGKGCMTEPA